LKDSGVILVTGGLGFIGSHMIKYLLKDESCDYVYNLDALSFGSNRSNVEISDIHRGKYKLLIGDINNINRIKFKQKPDIILNFAAETHVDRSISEPLAFVNSNYLGVYHLLEYARKNDIGKYVQISTDEVYGESPPDHSFREDDRLAPGNPYSATKAAADLLAISYSRTYGLDISITRCTNNFGPYQSAEKLIPATIMRILKGLPILLYGDGKQVRDWIYVYDHVIAIHRVIKNSNAKGIYNISASNLVSNNELVGKINRITEEYTGKHSLIKYVRDRPGHDKRYSLNAKKIKTKLKWKPEFNFDNALINTVKWYVSNKKWLSNSSEQYKKDKGSIPNSNYHFGS
jgi:dTDP-glucose 4,6-dehydratase